MEKLVFLLLLLPGSFCDLPVSFSVTSYDLVLKVPLDLTADVEGSVTITLTCTTGTDKVFLHWGSSLTPTLPNATDLTVTYVTDTSSTKVGIVSTAVNSYNQLNITTDTTCQVNGKVIVDAKFKTKLNKDNKGLFYRQYLIDNNQSNTVLMTNLRPTFARELFPCLDEPRYSGEIKLTLTYPDSWAAVATTNARSTEPGTDGTTKTVFSSITTPPNNFAFFLSSNMSHRDYSVNRSSTQLSFWYRNGLGSTSSDIIERLAAYYYLIEDIIGAPFPLGHLTIVMVPGLEEPFAGYGIIFLRENNYAQDYSSPQMEGLFKANVAPVVYEFLRQFSEFNMRPNTWSDYWMSPAIAQYLKYVILDRVMPPLDFKTDLEVSARQISLSLDSQFDAKSLYDTSIISDSTASVLTAVNDPLKKFKGAAIFNMLDQSLPTGIVFSTITSFLADCNNTAVTSENILAAMKGVQSPLLSSSAKQSLAKTLGYWFSSTQYPLETVKVISYTNQDSSGDVSFKTTAFCSALNPSCTPDLSGVYYLSATVGSKSDNLYYSPRQDLWVTNSAANSTVHTTIDVRDGDWVVANMKSEGYYRSNYESINWERIISALSSDDQYLLGRTQLLDDAFALPLSMTDALNYNITIRLALANLGNTKYRNWVPVQRGLQSFRDNLMGLNESTSYKNFAAGYFVNLNGFLQNTSTDVFEKARILALFMDDMCEYDISGYRAAAIGNLTDLLKGTLPKTVPSSAYDAVACCGGRYNSSLKAQTLWNLLADSTRNYYSRRYASIALGCLSNYTDVAQFYSTMTLADIQLKHYMQIALEYVADKNPVNFMNDFTKMADKFQSQLGAASIVSLITRAGRKINNNTDAATLNNLINNANVDPVVKSSAQNTKNTIAYRVNWLSTNNKTLVSALQSHTLPGGRTSGANSLRVMSLLVLLPFILCVLASICV